MADEIKAFFVGYKCIPVKKKTPKFLNYHSMQAAKDIFNNFI